jgi:isoleucyl-tRNA synthetase
MQTLRASGTTQLGIWEIALDDLVVTEVPKSGWMVASHEGESVALDLELTPALIAAGHVREVIRFIQERRKSDGFEISDRIDVKWNASAQIAGAIASDEAHIKDEVLALSMVQDSTLAIEDNEIGIAIKLTKAS